MPGMNERALSLLFRRYEERGDGRALAAVFDACARPLLELACHLVRDPAEAEDLVQATFLTAIQKRGTFDESAPLSAWLYGILWREAAKARRRAARRPDPARLGGRVEPEPQELLAADEVPSAVRAALARLPRAQREVLEPLLFEGERAERIAQSLARSPGTVRSQIHRGLEELRRALAPRFAAYGALALPVRGLAELRAEVLRAAGFSPATVATAPAVTLALTLGGVLVSKTVLAFAAAVVVSVTGTWLVSQRSVRAQQRELEEVRLALAAALERSAPPALAEPPLSSAEAVPAMRSASAPAATPAPTFDERVRYWLARFAEAPDDWRHGWSVCEEIAKLPDDEALAILGAVWPHLSEPVRAQAMKPFVFRGGKPYALKVLHLAATDAAASVQARAFAYLKSYAFQDFALDYAAYGAWAARYDELPLDVVLRENARRFVGDLLALTPAALAERTRKLEPPDLRIGAQIGVDLAAVLREAGGLRMLEACLATGDAEVRANALQWSKTLAADERWLRAWVLPAIEQPDAAPELAYNSFSALSRPDCGWAREPILAYLERATREPLAATSAAGTALAEIGDVAAIPRMIGLLLRDQTGQLDYDVGYFGLSRLTGVTWQKGYDGAWWRDWWEKNRQRFPPEVAAVEVER